MIVGNPEEFALESHISVAYAKRGQLGLGSFMVHILGRKYGVDEPDATLLACSYYSVLERCEMRGKHVVPFGNERDGKSLAQTCYDLHYADVPARGDLFGLSADACRKAALESQILWAPDGDEAFDDGSFILQFDLPAQVRLVAFKVGSDRIVEESSFTDARLPDSTYYGILERWHKAFFREWQDLPKAG